MRRPSQKPDTQQKITGSVGSDCSHNLRYFSQTKNNSKFRRVLTLRTMQFIDDDEGKNEKSLKLLNLFHGKSVTLIVVGQIDLRYVDGEDVVVGGGGGGGGGGG